MNTIPTNVTAERGKDDTSAAGAAPIAPVQATPSLDQFEIGRQMLSALEALEEATDEHRMAPHAICLAHTDAEREAMKRQGIDQAEARLSWAWAKARAVIAAAKAAGIKP